MDPMLILLIGLAIVVGGILYFRTHAFLALVIGAMAVAFLTSPEALQEYAAAKGMTDAETASLVAQTFGERVARGFGATAGKIGILIAMAAIIGTCLLESGAADRIVRSTLRAFGKKRAPHAFLSSGFLLGIPVFFDTVFYLLIPIAKAMGVHTHKNFLWYVMAIVAGGVMAHTLVPPTPGPLFVAAALNIDIGMMIVVGLALGIVTASCGFAYGWWANKRWSIDIPELSAEENESMAVRPESELPSFALSILPIVLPVVLIAGGTLLGVLLGDIEEPAQWQALLYDVFRGLGNSTVALTIGAIIALLMLARQFGGDRNRVKDSIQKALRSGGVIILITAAGGALGVALEQTGIGPRIEALAGNYDIAVLPLAFLVTSLVRTAQGSATVSMITAVGILAGFADPAVLGFHPVYLAMAIGCGSKPVPWMNDSGFWVVGRMSGMSESETLKTFSAELTIMGFAGIVAVMLAAKLFPLV
ncbi:MAG: SLC13 family permease [Lysobacterales bacterium]|jgi:GntP family gluconate:H+ symporter